MTSAKAVLAEHSDFDIVGDRVLVGAQVVNISRLSTHPMPMLSQGLVTVAGQGPKDSNGAGKSSLIAALSLLHADAQWRLANGAGGAADLLFTAEFAAQESQWSNVDHGYVIGVFADPAADTEAELAAGALTVWLRINRKAAHLDIRWRAGLYLPYGSTEAERAAGVDELWKGLTKSNGRTDYHANRLSAVLYGGHVRCVSFLSTSVRASPAANLLAQPLNDLSPQQIFNAIATLTGLDRELAKEQAVRSSECDERAKVEEIEADLSQWENSAQAITRDIEYRQTSREYLRQAQRDWRGRCARWLLAGVTQTAELNQSIAAATEQLAELNQQESEAAQEIAALANQAELAAKVEELRTNHRLIEFREQELNTQIAIASQRCEEQTGIQRTLMESARHADGRTPELASIEVAAAQTALETALQAQGVAAARAADRPDSAPDPTALPAPLAALTEAGIPAIPLIGALSLSSAQRATWEPRLFLYREAIVIRPEDHEPARSAIAHLPGSILILAGPAADPTGSALPNSQDSRFDLSGFMHQLAQRAGVTDIDHDAGIWVVGNFPEPLTAAATESVDAAARDQAVEQLAAAKAAVRAARQQLSLALGRERAARDAHSADQIAATIASYRAEIHQAQTAQATLAPQLAAARADLDRALGAQVSRADRLQTFREHKARLGQQSRQLAEERSRLKREMQAVALAERHRLWGSTAATAQEYLEGFSEREQWSMSEWDHAVTQQVERLVQTCFPSGTPPSAQPTGLRELLRHPDWLGAITSRIPLLAPMMQELAAHLDATLAHDQHQAEQLARERDQRSRDLAGARSGYAQAQQGAQVLRSSLAQAIKARLKSVSGQFQKLDESYGGYGALLEVTEPEPPADPELPWQWAVTPKWRRAEGQSMTAYKGRSNTAQMDEKAVKLVCAAALAGGGQRPLLLILDELGRNLGKQHRREAVALFENIGRDHKITVIGALQDDMERYAIEASGLYIKLRRRSDSLAYNEAPVIIGDDRNTARVALLQEWLSSYRPEAPPLSDFPAVTLL